MQYYNDFVEPNKKYRAPVSIEIDALRDLRTALERISTTTDAQDIQTEVFEVGKNTHLRICAHGFKVLYEVLLRQEEGPRMGSLSPFMELRKLRR